MSSGESILARTKSTIDTAGFREQSWTGTFAEYRFGIATLGAKVLFYNRDELPVSKVFDGRDEPVLSPSSDLVSAAITRALAAKVLR